mgnify:FL=1|nr:MAG TPA: Protein of unknown function (DUF1492) [Caudoviricetes sp.]
MTLRELSQLYYLNREIERDKRELERLKWESVSPRTQRMTGMPHGSGYENIMEQKIAAIADLEGLICAKMTQCIYERNRLERYIADIPDSLTRQIFALRFINGMSWVQVAMHVGGDNTAGSVKMICYRYLNKSNR